MRKVYLAGGVLALLLIAALGTYWLMQPCRALDGLFGPSECSGSVTLEGFLPVEGIVVSPRAADELVSVFGRSYVNGAPATPAMARIDPETGREVERIDLPYLEGNGYWWMAFSDDGRTARITCRVAEPRTADGWMSATIDFATGAVIETDPLESWPDDPFHIDPADAVPNDEGQHLRAVLCAANGERKVAVWGRGEMELYDADDARIARLSDGRHFHVSFIDHVNAVSVSPSGDMIAALFPTATMAPALLRLWSAGDGAPLAEIELPYRYSGSYAPAWPDGSDMVALVRTIEHRPDNSATATNVDTVIDFYRVPVED